MARSPSQRRSGHIRALRDQRDYLDGRLASASGDLSLTRRQYNAVRWVIAVVGVLADEGLLVEIDERARDRLDRGLD